MFDDLRESLGRFRSDVEESAEVEEEGADEAPEDEGAAESDEEADATPESDEVADASAEPDEATEATAEPDEAAETTGERDEAAERPDAAAPETTAAAGDAAVAEEEAVPEEPTGGEDGEVTEDAGGEVAGEEDGEAGDGEDDDGPGIAARAKSLATGRVYIDEDDLEGPLWDLEMALLSNDVAMPVAEDLTDRLRENLVGERRGIATRTGSVVEDAIFDALLEVLSVGQFDFDERVAAADPPVVIIFTGVNGVGKTTTIAKLARYFERQGRSTVMANGDTFRAGANEQIEEHAERLDVPLIHHERGGDPAAVIYDAVEYAEAHDVDVVLGDTAGRLHTSDDLMAQLAKIDRVVGPDMTVFVDEAVAGQDAVERAQTFDEAAEIDGAVLTKADADASGGAAISVAHVTGKPILFLGVGQGYDDLERFDPEAMVERLLGE